MHDWRNAGQVFFFIESGEDAVLLKAPNDVQSDMENSTKCLIFLFVVVTSAIGLPMAYYGDKCKNAELRAQNKNDTCKDIHNDASAKALLYIGFILSLPLQIVVFIIMCYCACFCLVAMCADDNTVAPSDNNDSGGAFVLGFVGAMMGFSDWFRLVLQEFGWMLSLPSLAYSSLSLCLCLAKIQISKARGQYRCNSGHKCHGRFGVIWEITRLNEKRTLRLQTILGE